MNYTFTTIITQEGKWYVSRCVELDVVSQGRTIEKAQENLKEAVRLYLEGEPKSKIKKLLSKSSPLVTTFSLRHV